jgi:hypothetical protein
MVRPLSAVVAMLVLEPARTIWAGGGGDVTVIVLVAGSLVPAAFDAVMVTV